MRKLVKLFWKSLCVMFPMLVAIGYFHARPMSYADGEIPYYIWNKDKASTTSDKPYEMIILGDSVANAAYAPEILSDRTLNLSLGGTTTVENYYILRDWLEHNKAPKVCYISFMDFHMATLDCFWTRSMYSHRFRFDQNAEMLYAATKYDGPGILSEHPVLDYLSYELRLPNKYIAAFTNASFNQRYKGNAEARRLNELHGGRYIGRGTTEYQSDSENVYTEFTVAPLIDVYYRKILALCRENQITVRIIKLPLPENRVFTEEYEKSFYAYYDALEKDYPEITVDWIKTSYPQAYFTDVHHMNSHGALQFGEDLKKRYPEDFGDAVLSEEQIAAINDSIAGENKLEQILKWIAGKEYTVLLYDGEDEMDTLYPELQEKEPDLKKLSLRRMEDGIKQVFFVSGTNETHPDLSVYEEDGIRKARLPGDAQEQWETSSDHVLGVMVIDRYHQRVVCRKEFKEIRELRGL